MNQPEKLAEEDKAPSLWDPEYLQKARQAVTQLLEGSLPTQMPKGSLDTLTQEILDALIEEYGPWAGQVLGFAQIFHKGMDLQEVLASMLHQRKPRWVVDLLHGARDSSGRPWDYVLGKKFEQMMEKARRKLAEERMQERLARTTGDSMADEIMAMLREQDLARTDIYRRYDRNVSAARINDALFVLERLGWARWKLVPTGGRKREVWHLLSEEEEQQPQQL
jgi:hypothetical protein